jgi:endonuclease YncB( thermonuclease family)
MRIMRKPAVAIALAALVLVVPSPAGAAGARAHSPAGGVPARPQPHFHPQQHSQQLGQHRGAGHPRYPYAHLVPGLVVHPPHRPVHRVVVVAPVAYGFTQYAPQYLQAPAIALDGDTFDSGGVRYRLYGIDTPELGEPLGQQARARLQQLLAMGQVSVIPVAVDVYGRLVAEVMVAGLNVAGVLRAEGYAKS